MAKSVIGLDIGSFSIKLVELEYDNNRYKLKNYNIRDLFTESETYDSEGPGAARLETAVREVFSSLKISPKKQRNINTAFGGPSVAVKQVRSIPLASDEMESALIFEARKHLPLDESDAIIDYQILRGDMQSQDMDILLVATTKKVFDGRIQMFKNIGITPNVIDAEILALINSYFVAQGSLLGEEALVFLNIGAKYSTIGIIGEKTLLFNRDISWAGDNFTEDIKNIMKVEYPEAETVKKERGIGALLGGGESNAGGIRVARRMALDNLTDEIRRSLRYYTKETGCREFSKILLSGGSSLFSNLNSHLAQQLNMTVEIYNPFSSFITPPGFDDNLGSRLAVACGLALREE
jgi:type IV pilus assembly protein PilM